MHSNSVKQNLNILLGIGIIIGAGVYAGLDATADHFENLTSVGFLMITMTAFLTAFSHYELAGASTIYLMRSCSNSKLPSFLLEYVLVVTAAVVITVAASFLQSYLPLTEMLTNIASGRVSDLLFVCEGLLSMLVLGRMVYEVATKTDLSKLLSPLSPLLVSSTRATNL